MGVFSGSRPKSLGVTSGKLAPHHSRPNNVHSQVDSNDSHYIAPIKPARAPVEAFEKLKEIVRSSDRVKVIEATPDYVYFETSSPGMGFVDDNEFYLDRKGGVIHVRAAARLGIRDFDANRKRIEGVRKRLHAAGY
jgi:uncharacterized protein (DUF1499 family)